MGRAWQGREKTSKQTNKQLHSSTKYYLKAGVVEMEEMEPPVFPPKKHILWNAFLIYHQMYGFDTKNIKLNHTSLKHKSHKTPNLFLHMSSRVFFHCYEGIIWQTSFLSWLTTLNSTTLNFYWLRWTYF